MVMMVECCFALLSAWLWMSQRLMKQRACLGLTGDFLSCAGGFHPVEQSVNIATFAFSASAAGLESSSVQK